MMVPVVRVWAAPKHGHKYLVTADLSEAGPDSDPQSVSVWDATEKWKPVQAAHLYTRRVRPGELGILAAILTKIYGGDNNYALLVPEKNSTGGGMFIERVRNHWNLYRRTTFGKVEQEETIMLGWSTDAFSKGPMLEDAYRMLGEMGKSDHCPVNSEEMLLQLMAYEERIKADVQGRTKVDWGHKPGTHDDCVTDFCIAMRIIKHEHEKLSTCKIEKPVIASQLQSLRKFEKRANHDRNSRGIASQKAPSIQDLKRKFGGGPRHA
jgi:hypothetical protein